MAYTANLIDEMSSYGRAVADTQWDSYRTNSPVYACTASGLWLSANGGSFPHYWYYDFGANNKKTITQVGIQPNGSGRVKDFVIAGSDDLSTWDTLDTDQHGNNADMEYFQFTNTTAYQYYRIYHALDNWNTDGYMDLKQVEMMETLVTPPTWYDESWLYRFKLTIDATKVAATLGDTFYIDLSNMDSDFWTYVDSNGYDIRITKADGITELPRDVVWVNTGTSTGEVWFKHPDVDGSSDTDIYVYVGNSGITADYLVTDFYGRENTWDYRYRGVYNFQVNSFDSTDNSNDLTDVGSPAYSAGKFGNSWVNTATTARYSYQTTAGSLQCANKSMTCMFWGYKGNETKICQGVNALPIGGGYNSGYEIQMADFTADVQLSGYLRIAGNNRGWAYNPATGGRTTYRFNAMAFDKSVPEVRINVNNDTDTDTSGLTTGGIGTTGCRWVLNVRASDLYTSAAHGYQNRYDALRIMDEALSHNDLSTHYLNESANNTFFTWGTIESQTNISKVAGVAQANIKEIIGVTSANAATIAGVDN